MEALNLPQETQPVSILDWKTNENGLGNGQKGVQNRADHQQIASRQATAQPGEHGG
jgi:hypothetical protein